MSTIHDPDYIVLIKLLQEKRLEAELTQQQLASKLNVGQAYISKYEQFQKRVDVIELRNICDAIGISFEQFIHEFLSKCKEA